MGLLDEETVDVMNRDEKMEVATGDIENTAEDTDIVGVEVN